MILAFDTYYFDGTAKTVCLAFKHWGDKQSEAIYSEVLEKVADYIPGEFYKRELPCILSLLKTLSIDTIDTIIVDGYVYLDDTGKPGLGGHLYNSLETKIPIIGVAKTNFLTLTKNKKLVLRGESASPLYITAIGMDLELAAKQIKSMSGEYRIPALLKELDKFTKA